MKVKSIRFKLWAGMMSMVLIVLLLLWFFQIVFLQSFYTNIRISNVKNEASSIVQLWNGENSSEFQNKLDTFAFNNNLSIELLDREGKSSYTAGTMGMGAQMPMMRNSIRIDSINQAFQGNTVSLPVTHPRFGYKFMMIGIPVKTAGEITGVLIINMPLAAVDETVSILKLQLFYITLVLLAAALVISFLISKSFTKPVLEIKRVSEIMASGDFSARVDNKKQDEIGQLADTVNFLGQQLSKIDKLRKDLIANVSHELRTPLSLIRGYAETIRDVSGEYREKREKHLEIIIEETDRLSSIVNDILNLSQLQSGYFNLNISTFKFKSLLDSIVKRYEVLIVKKDVKIILESCNDADIKADRGRIEQVLYNLINNAFNYTPPGGTITLRALEKPDIIRFEVSDTGRGIPEKELPLIWDRFYKADKNSGEKSVGTGLGLAIVKSVLEAHKALYGAQNNSDNGATFWFELKR